MSKFLTFASSCLLAACVTTDRGEVRPDLRKIDLHVEAAEQSFREKALLLVDLEPGLSDAFARVSGALQAIDLELDRAIAAGDGAPDLVGLIDLTLSLTDRLTDVVASDPDVQLRARLAISFVRDILRQVKIELGSGGPTPP